MPKKSQKKIKMTPKIIISCIIFALSLGVGQLFFKLAAEDVKLKLSSSFMGAIFSHWLIIALVIYAFSTILWIWILMQTQLSKAYPFALLGAAFVPILAKIFIGESISSYYIAGILLILIGLYVIQIT